MVDKKSQKNLSILRRGWISLLTSKGLPLIYVSPHVGFGGTKRESFNVSMEFVERIEQSETLLGKLCPYIDPVSRLSFSITERNSFPWSIYDFVRWKHRILGKEIENTSLPHSLILTEKDYWDSSLRANTYSLNPIVESTSSKL
jgi:hypothetical protein